MNAPNIASTPPADHTPRIRNGVCTCCATTYGLMKMPEPTMPPITIMVASNSPSWRRGLVSAKPPVYYTDTRRTIHNGVNVWTGAGLGGAHPHAHSHRRRGTGGLLRIPQPVRAAAAPAAACQGFRRLGRGGWLGDHGIDHRGRHLGAAHRSHRRPLRAQERDRGGGISAGRAHAPRGRLHQLAPASVLALLAGRPHAGN